MINIILLVMFMVVVTSTLTTIAIELSYMLKGYSKFIWSLYFTINSLLYPFYCNNLEMIIYG